MDDKIDAPWSKDKMARQGVAKFLTKYLDSNDDIQVLNVNAPWGAGKTFFLENWCAELEQERAVIYFNAWKHDYAGDAFIALTASINDSLLDSIPLAGAEEKLRDFRSKATNVILAATPALAKGVLKKFTGVDLAVISDITDAEDLSSAAEKALEELLKSNRSTMETVSLFKDKFSSLAKEAALHKASAAEVEVRPLYIFIDELDRCRPTFSIELLERIKHFFDIKGCKFIIACDIEQLQHSIGAVYGSGFEGARYLKRFFDSEYTLDYSNIDTWVESCDIDSALFADMPIQLNNAAGNGYFSNRHQAVAPHARAFMAYKLELNKAQVILLTIAKTFKLKLRELEKAVRHIRAICSVVEQSDFDFFLAMYLVVLRDESPELYRSALQNNDNKTWAAINAKYPPYYLYSGVSNDSVHEIANKYLGYMQCTDREIRDYINKEDNSKPLYSFVLWRFANNGYEIIRRYPHYVDLAHSIE